MTDNLEAWYIDLQFRKCFLLFYECLSVIIVNKWSECKFVEEALSRRIPGGVSLARRSAWLYSLLFVRRIIETALVQSSPFVWQGTTVDCVLLDLLGSLTDESLQHHSSHRSRRNLVVSQVFESSLNTGFVVIYEVYWHLLLLPTISEKAIRFWPNFFRSFPNR